jgi:branched-subunit amino acid transport protein
MADFWPVALSLGLGTFLIRFSFILIMDKLTLPDAFTRMLRFIPASVLPALVAPAVLLHGNGWPASFADLERPLAGLVAILVAWRTKSVILTIAGGMGALWILKAIL